MGGNSQTGPATRRNFHGRRVGKALRPGQKALLAELLDNYRIPGVAPAENRQRQPVDPGAGFGNVRQIWLEVGFGSGEHLVRQAAENPDIGFVGCEPYVNGVASLLAKLRNSGLENVRIHPGDVREFFDVAADNSIGKVFVLYPDPWPKTRHHRRRFVTAEYLEPLARICMPGAEIRLATDIADLARQAVVEFGRMTEFSWTAGRRSDWTTPWPGWRPTRYEDKAISQGRSPIYLTFARSNAGAMPDR